MGAKGPAVLPRRPAHGATVFTSGSSSVMRSTASAAPRSNTNAPSPSHRARRPPCHAPRRFDEAIAHVALAPTVSGGERRQPREAQVRARSGANSMRSRVSRRPLYSIDSSGASATIVASDRDRRSHRAEARIDAAGVGIGSTQRDQRRVLGARIDQVADDREPLPACHRARRMSTVVPAASCAA